MRHSLILPACLIGALALAGCTEGAGVARGAKGVNVIDESGLNDIMLSAADPAEAVAYFSRASAAEPERIDLARGLAQALIRAGQAEEGAKAWARVTAMGGATDADRVEHAGARIRTGDWEGARALLDKIPPTFESYERYRYEAMVADSRKDWSRADSFYETAAGLTTTPSGVLNNWGFSKLTRGDFKGAEKLFGEALTYDPGMFTAKNNLVLARGAQARYDLPMVQMTQVERAQLLHTAALTAIKQGDVATGKGLLLEAMETHPQHFEAAARSLAALDGTVVQ